MAKNPNRSGPGPSKRQLRVGELIRRTLSEILMRADIHDPELNRMSITVGEVRTTGDLRVATVYILSLGGGEQAEALEALERNKYELRRAVSKAVGLKHSPELRFFIDDTFDRLDEARRLFAQENVRRDIEAEDD
jgi:ribosome-binding factor A